MTRIKRGEYEIKMHPSGGSTIRGPGIRKRGVFLMPDEKLRARCQAYFNQGNRALPKTLKGQLGYRGIVACGRRNISEGKKAIGIDGPYVDTKRGKVKSGVEVPEQDIQDAIRKFWPRELITRFQKGEVTKLPNISEFLEQYRREYTSAQTGRRRKLGGFKAIFKKVYPGLYVHVVDKITPDEIDIASLRDALDARVQSGLSINPASLRYSENPDVKVLYKQLCTLVQKPSILSRDLFNKKKKTTFAKIIAAILKINEKDMSTMLPAKGSRNFIASLTEELVHVFFRWALLLDYDLGEHTPESPIYNRGKERQLVINGDTCMTDLRIGSGALEIKSGMGVFQGKELDELVTRYAPKKHKWTTGKRLEWSKVLFHTSPGFYQKASQRISDAGIQILGYEWFFSNLIDLVQKMSEEYSSEIEKVRPRISNLAYLVDLSEELVTRPHIITRECNAERRTWTLSVLKSLAEKAKELKNDA